MLNSCFSDAHRILSSPRAQFLIRLGHADRALAIFLRGRSAAIKADIRTIKFQGDLSVYVSELRYALRVWVVRWH